MSLPSIAIVNFSTQLDEQHIQDAVRAINRQVLEDFAPIWGHGRVCKLHRPVFDPGDIDTLADDPVYADSVIYLVDEGLLPGALGFHDLNGRDIPFGFVFILDPDDWTVTLSHEVLELITDPTVNIFVPGPDPRDPAKVVLHTYENCDAVERTAYQIDEISVSNFLTPSYFTQGEAAGTRNDFLGVDVPSFGVTSGSHIQFFDLASGKFETKIGEHAIPQRVYSQKRFVEHDKAGRPSEDELGRVLATYQQERPRGRQMSLAPRGLPAVRGLSRAGRYRESAARLL